VEVEQLVRSGLLRSRGIETGAEASHRVSGLIVQNGYGYKEELKEFWDPIKAYGAIIRSPSQGAECAGRYRDDKVSTY